MVHSIGNLALPNVIIAAFLIMSKVLRQVCVTLCNITFYMPVEVWSLVFIDTILLMCVSPIEAINLASDIFI
jgi:hypothetical protein